jgi:threonyl-tRNA synthetase
LGVPFVVQPGAGAFYGPKLEWSVPDRTGRAWQCGTIQFDLVLPARFDVRYVGADGQRLAPVMLHRALYGSLERFLGLVLERHGRALPAWLAPVQVALLPLADGQAAAARDWADRLQARGLRVEVQGEDSLARRIAGCHERGIPLVAVVGPREQAAGTLALRGEGGRSTALAGAEAIEALVGRCTPPV